MKQKDCFFAIALFIGRGDVMIELTKNSDRNQIYELMAECMWPDAERINRAIDTYMDEQSKTLYGFFHNNELVGLIGVSGASDHAAILNHIAVKKEHRRNGLGTYMIKAFLQGSNVTTIEAETDKDAVAFYKKIGFEITSLGEKYPGVERFRCIFEG